MIYIPILKKKQCPKYCINEEYGIRNESRILYIVIGCYIKLT